MLLTDGKPNTTEDLRAYESAILSVANTESIDLEVKLQLALDEVTFDVLDFLLSRSGNLNFSAAQGSAISIDPKAGVRRMTGVSDVVITPQMKRWHALHALEIVYRDTFNNQLNDRYQAKVQEYSLLAKQARLLTLQYGVGIVSVPLRVAPLPTFDFVATSVIAATYFVRATWVNASGQEGAPSAVTNYDAPAGSVPVITLNDPPFGAVGFNIYVGATPETVSLQNTAPVAIGTAFTVPTTGLIEGAAPGDGQYADVYVTNATMLRRG